MSLSTAVANAVAKVNSLYDLVKGQYDKWNADQAVFRQKVWDDVGGALGQFVKSIYVDAINGNDTNDGSYQKPFKTIKKACDSVAVGGYADIKLIGSQTKEDRVYYLVDEGIVLINKVITFHYVDNKYVGLKFKCQNWDNFNVVMGFNLVNSSLSFSTGNNYLTLENAPKLLNDRAFRLDKSGIINIVKGTNSVAIGTYPKTVDIYCKDGGSDIINVIGRDTMLGTTGISLDFTKVHLDRVEQENKFIKINSACLSFHTYDVNFLDNDGYKPVNGFIRGVVRDTNNVPRNILSNQIL